MSKRLDRLQIHNVFYLYFIVFHEQRGGGEVPFQTFSYRSNYFVLFFPVQQTTIVEVGHYFVNKRFCLCSLFF